MNANNTDACCSSCTSTKSKEAPAIACTLSADDFKERVSGIRELASRHLLSSRREPLALHLAYASDALRQVEDLVAKESACCSFLHFDLLVGHEVQLTITAPSHAAAAADELFAHFAPELARVAA